MLGLEFSELVLLVGTNPLPNYVVAKYFIENNSKLKNIWLVHSEKIEGYQNGTLKFAENIEKVIKGQYGNKYNMRPVALSDVSSSKAIENDIRNKFLNQINNRHEVHLNYTGGTKAMSVHVYRILEKALRHKCTFSYLDARDYKIKFDNEEFITDDLRKQITISSPELMKLHGYDDGGSDDNPDWPEAVEYFKYLIDTDRLPVYLEWAKKVLNKYYYNNKGKFINKKNSFLKHNCLVNENQKLDIEKMKKIRQEFKKDTPTEVFELLKRIPAEHSLLDDDNQMWLPDMNTSNKEFENRLKKSIEDFLHGKWLESYVYSVMQKNFNQSDFDKKLNTIERSRKPKIEKNFEIDLIVLNGYQLCGISCTTMQNSGSKMKGFEVLHRVNQFGGEESKAILITCAPDKTARQIQKDLATVTGSLEDKLLVIGVEKLKEDLLWQEIKKHIWG